MIKNKKVEYKLVELNKFSIVENVIEVFDNIEDVKNYIKEKIEVVINEEEYWEYEWYNMLEIGEGESRFERFRENMKLEDSDIISGVWLVNEEINVYEIIKNN